MVPENGEAPLLSLVGAGGTHSDSGGRSRTTGALSAARANTRVVLVFGTVRCPGRRDVGRISRIRSFPRSDGQAFGLGRLPINGTGTGTLCLVRRHGKRDRLRAGGWGIDVTPRRCCDSNGVGPGLGTGCRCSRRLAATRRQPGNRTEQHYKSCSRDPTAATRGASAEQGYATNRQPEGVPERRTAAHTGGLSQLSGRDFQDGRGVATAARNRGHWSGSEGKIGRAH